MCREAMREKEFSPLVYKFLDKQKCLEYLREEELRSFSKGLSRPDFIAKLKSDDFTIIVGEIKSPREIRNLEAWSDGNSSDSQKMCFIRGLVKKLDDVECIPVEIGGHAIIMLGQIHQYIKKLKDKLNQNESIVNDPRWREYLKNASNFLGAYAFPAWWEECVEEAVILFDINVICRLGDSNVKILIFEDRNLCEKNNNLKKCLEKLKENCEKNNNLKEKLKEVEVDSHTIDRINRINKELAQTDDELQKTNLKIERRNLQKRCLQEFLNRFLNRCLDKTQ